MPISPPDGPGKYVGEIEWSLDPDVSHIWDGERWILRTQPDSVAKLEREIAYLRDINARQFQRIRKLEDAIQKVLDDEESGEGGWGPDVTAVEWLKEALEP